MDKQNLMPTAAQPVNRITTGQLPRELAELSEEALSQLGGSDGVSSASARLSDGVSSASARLGTLKKCSYDGDDAE